MTTEERVKLLRRLLALGQPTADLVASLSQLGWDSTELVHMTTNDARAVLQRVLAGELSAEIVEEWANAIEGRDDIGFYPPCLNDMVFELANPTLVRPVLETAKKWEHSLTEAAQTPEPPPA